MSKITPAIDQDKKNLKDEHLNAITTLEQIKDAPTMTQAQVIQAVQYMAKVMLFLVKLVARQI